MDKTTENLFGQFVKAKGIKNYTVNGSIINEFTDWLMQMKVIGRSYADLLDYMDLDFMDDDCIEVGKSSKNSVVIPYETKIITDDKNLFSNIDENRVMIGDFHIFSGVPYLFSQYGIEAISNINTFMTQNPYSYYLLNNWSDLPNKKEADIIVGVYGHNSDKDKVYKIKSIENLKDRLNCQYTEEYYEHLNEYYYALGTNKYITKQASKTRSRCR